MSGRYLWLAMGLLATGCAIAGVILPLVPATPFLLVAAYAFARSSPRLHRWLMTHRRFGPLIRNWQQHGSIDPKVKAVAVIVMVLTLMMSWAFGLSASVLAVQAVVMTGAAWFVLSRPSGPRS